MKNLLKLLALGLLINVSPLMAKLTLSIDRQEISAGETFMLDIQIENDSDATLDLSMIPSDFTIVSNSQYQHTQIINGRRSSIKGWKLKLKTLKSGPITIPSIQIGNQATQPIHLIIKDNSFQVDLNGQDKAIFLTAEVDQSSPFVQQQVILTLSLYRSVATHYENLSAPIVENSIIEKLGDDVVFDKIIENKSYTVYQRKYIIFPQQSGTIEIGAINFTADVNDSRRNRSRFLLNSTRPISIATKPIILSVKAKPAAAANPWLPAENVVLAERWSINTQELTVGEPVTWTLLLTVQGLSESQLPELEIPKIEGLQMYPDAPQKERQVNARGILGQRIEKFAVIPSREGQVTIPAIELKWWDTKNNTQKTATLAARTFNVRAAGSVTLSSVSLPPLPNQTTDALLRDSTDVRLWQLLCAGLLLLWLVTLFAYFNRRTQAQASRDSKEIATNSRLKVQKSHKQALKKARAYLKTGMAQELEAAILEMINSLNLMQYHSLGALNQRLSNNASNKELIQKLDALQQGRYSASQQKTYTELTNNDLEQIIEQISQPHKHTGCEVIPPLYPR